MHIEVIAKIDVSLNNGATTRLLDFCEDLAPRNQVRMWVQRARVPPMLRSIPGLEVRLLPAPTPPAAPDWLKATRALWYEASLAVGLPVELIWHGRSDAIHLREVATIAPALVGALFRVPLFMEIDGSPYRDALREGGIWQRLRARVLRTQARLCAES